MSADDLLSRADELTSVDRQQTYGSPSISLGRAAILFNAWIKAAKGVEANLEAQDVPMLMILMKQARLMNGHHSDSLVDIAGYAKCVEMIHDATHPPSKVD